MIPTDGMRVLLVTPNLDVGGAQETVRSLAKYFPRLGCPTMVCTLADGPLRAEIESLGIEVAVVPGRRSSVLTPWSFLGELLRIRRDLVQLAQHHRADVVLQTQTYPALNLLVLSLGRSGRHRMQAWWTIQNTVFIVDREKIAEHAWSLGPKRLVHRAMFRLGSRAVTGVVAVSDETADAFRAMGGDSGRTHVVCNAVDVERYPARVDRAAVRAMLGLEATDHVMTMVGTFKRQKGHRHLVEALATVAAGLPRLHLVLAGDGELRRSIEAQVDANGLRDRVHFLGTRRDVPELLAASDSFVLPSLWEGLPLALVEAMASGLPVIATAVSGTTQVMTDGLTGWVVPPGDSAALARAMHEVLDDPVEASARGAMARERAQRFTAAAQAEELERLFAAAGSRRRVDPRVLEGVR
ncbi:MAG TPA: glycosyltransferase [Acidimicrobiia bacterium]|nr:glycosyltransferase [Acidimicrobiia bacterium]